MRQIPYFGINFRGYKLSRFRDFFWRSKVFTREIACSVPLAKEYSRNLTFKVTREILIKNTTKWSKFA